MAKVWKRAGDQQISSDHIIVLADRRQKSCSLELWSYTNKLGIMRNLKWLHLENDAILWLSLVNTLVIASGAFSSGPYYRFGNGNWVRTAAIGQLFCFYKMSAPGATTLTNWTKTQEKRKKEKRKINGSMSHSGITFSNMYLCKDIYIYISIHIYIYRYRYRNIS
jgi:hypothetical protein